MDDTPIHSDDFPALWAAHQIAVLVYIMGAIPQYQDAQDVLQKVAVVAFRKQEAFNPQCMEFVAWVRAIARFEILRFRRDHARDRLVFDEATLKQLEVAQHSLSFELEDRFAALQKCLQSLQSRARRVLALRYGDGVAPTKIAEQMQTSVSAINAVLHKARQSLRTCIQRQLDIAGSK